MCRLKRRFEAIDAERAEQLAAEEEGSGLETAIDTLGWVNYVASGFDGEVLRRNLEMDANRAIKKLARRRR
jgi:hypothetical protein